MGKKRVLILCTGNSCRSQLAEAIVNHDLSGEWKAFSAGTKPTGTVHPYVFKVLAEINIVHHGVSKSAEEFRDFHFDVVVTVCDDAAENCPIWLGGGKKIHIGFPDPAMTVGPEEKVLAAFRQVRDDIREKIIPYLTHY